MRNNFKVASIFAALVVVWLASGLFSEPEAPVPNLMDAMASMSDSSLPSVVIEEVRSESGTRRRVLRGKTVSKQTASVSAESSGIVVSRPVERGARVSEVQVLFEIAIEDSGSWPRLSRSPYCLHVFFTSSALLSCGMNGFIYTKKF